MTDPALWVGIAFFIFFGLVYKPVGRILSKSLDARAGRIQHELEEAQRLREEAQATLTAYQRKFRQVTEEADEILNTARNESKQMNQQAQETLKHAIEARLAAADEKIAQEEQKALQQIQRQVVDIAIEAAQRIITEQLDKESDANLIKLATSNIPRVMH